MKKLIDLTKEIRFMIDNFLFYSNRVNKEKLKKLKGKYENRPLIIVGNGPSLNKIPLHRLKYPCIGLNKIDLIYGKTSWRPEMIICINGLVIRQNRKVFCNSKIPLVLPVKSIYLGIKPRENIFLIRETKCKQFETNILNGVGAGFTVTYTALQIAYYMRANPVYLIGVDHSFNFKGNPNEVQRLYNQDDNHFDPNYFKGQLWGLPDLESSEQAYFLAKKAFENDERFIYDATINGKLNIFEKRDINEILN